MTLTMWHMAFCSVAAATLVRLGHVPATEGITREVALNICSLPHAAP